jgi:hypothetical protein
MPMRQPDGARLSFLALQHPMQHPSDTPATAWQVVPDRDFLAFRLIALAELQLETYFADPAEIEAYRRPSRRASGRGKPAATTRVFATWKRDGVALTLAALPAAESFQVSLRGVRFSAVLTLRYVPEEATLQAATVEQFSGDIPAALAAASSWLEDVPDDRGDPPYVPPADPGWGTPLASPPPPTVADTREVKALTRAVATELRQHGTPSLDTVSNAWLESQPQSLWPLLDAAVAASTARRRDEALVSACRWLLANQLELIRYRLERGHDWARAMLDAYQEKLIALVQAKTLPEPDWFELVNLLKVAKVPIQPEMAEALAMAAAQATPDEAPGAVPQELSCQLRGLLDELGTSAESPFMVVEGLAESGTLMPAELRAYLTLELGLSPHAVLREAVPLLLLDAEPTVRQAAAAVLEQVVSPETVSPVMLRRTLLVRNWVPEAEREAVDRLVRKARVKGVACAQWAAAPALAIQGSMVDGSGAQSLILTTPAGRTGLFVGLLLKQGFGIRDAWCNASEPRPEINRSIKETQRTMTWHATGRDHLDVVVQHHIARGLAAGHLPQVTIVEIAEAIGAVDWKDRGLDVAAEIELLFAGLGAALCSPAAIVASLRRGGVWMAKNPMMQSWFEDDAAIRALVEGRPRPKPELAVRRVLEEVLPARREAWAERLLLLVLWLRGGTGEALSAGRWQDCVVLAHALLAGRPLADLPAMVAIAERSIFAARAGTW